MKKLSVLLLALVITITALSQEVVKWSYAAKKVKDKTYEIHVVANIASGYFIYSQIQPKQSISEPTVINFRKNDSTSIPAAPLSEVGVMIRKRYPESDYVSNTYRDTVSFVQTIVLKSNEKTNVEGVIHFQACSDYVCLPSAEARFSLTLQ